MNLRDDGPILPPFQVKIKRRPKRPPSASHFWRETNRQIAASGSQENYELNELAYSERLRLTRKAGRK